MCCMHDQASNKMANPNRTSYPVYESSDFEDRERIGEGGYGNVYRAILKAKNCAVAIKSIDRDEQNDDIIKAYEGGLLRNLKHENIITIFGSIRTDGNHAEFVMEYAEDGDLHSLLFDNKKDPEYSYRHVISWSLQAAKGLEFIHEKRMFHRDFKPSNLLLLEGYTKIKIGDLDFCKSVDVSRFTTNRGTLYYIAPEVRKTMGDTRSNFKYNEACDVYSFGMTLWAMISRENPAYSSPFKMSADAKGLVVAPFTGGPKIVNQIIIRCLEADPQRRPTMKNIVKALEPLDKIVNHVKPEPVMKQKDRIRCRYLDQLAKMIKSGKSVEEIKSFFHNKLKE